MAKPSSSLNLINDSAMVESGKKLYNAVKKFAPYKKIKQAVYLSRVEGNKSSRFITVSINMNEQTGGAPFARAFDTGSGVHGKNKRTYPIVPKRFSSLQFIGTNAFSGQVIRTKLVNHPGVKGVEYTKRAIESVRSGIRNTLAKDVKENLRLYLKTTFSKLGE